MKSSAFLLLSIAVYAAFGILVDESLNIDGDYLRFIEIEGNDGVMHEIDLNASPNETVLEEFNNNPTSNTYFLFTRKINPWIDYWHAASKKWIEISILDGEKWIRKNPTSEQSLVLNDELSVTRSNFNPDVTTVVVVHGWLVNQLMTMSNSLRDVFLETGDVNVIVVDWRLLALQDYVTASAGTPSVGRSIGQFLEFLHDVTGTPYSSMHLVGFSLGAHAVGNAGRQLNGQVSRITGLDPAGPLWTVHPEKLDKSDGRYVEGIHTNGGASGLGFGLPLGDVDFFPNGGISQPGCLTSLCEHNRSWQFFVATVRYNHLIGNQCSNIAQVTLNTCRGQHLHMGNGIITKTGSGMYRVNTGILYPY